MIKNSKSYLVTGGAGFIGSYLVDALIKKGDEVIVFDNMSTGHCINKDAEMIKGDLLNKNDLKRIPVVNEVWHLAANPEVRESDSDVHERQNFIATKNLAEWMKNRNIKKIYFTSTSAIYGEPAQIPTPEDYSPLKPISAYGISKLKAENLIISSGLQYIIFRFANVIGKRSGHGVISDFVKKLQKNKNEMEILGDGKQKKSYIHITDCIDAMLFCAESLKSSEIINIGTEDQIIVDDIAKIAAKSMGLSTKFSHTGGKRGWKGDVPIMLLSIKKLKDLNWKPRLNSRKAVELTAKEILEK